MSLYYELDPADENAEPQLPPLLNAEKVSKDVDVFQKAISSTKTSETGTVFYSEKNEIADIAILLNPEVDQKKCNQMIYVLTVAAGDAIGALAPPEVIVTHSFPGYIFLNKGDAEKLLDIDATLSNVPLHLSLTAIPDESMHLEQLLQLATKIK